MRCHRSPISIKISTGAILTILALFFCLPVTYGQTREEIVNNARLYVQLIDIDPGLQTIKLENEDFLKRVTDGARRMTAYFKGDTIYKIIIWNSLPRGVSQYEYYLKNAHPFFIYETQKGFLKTDSSGSPDRTILAFNFEGRYYLDNGQLIDKKIKGRKRPLDEDTDENSADDGSNPDIKSLLANADSYIRIIEDRLKEIGKQ